MTNTQKAATDVVEILTNNLAKINDELQRYKDVLLGTPYVIEVSPDLYLVADGTGYRAGSIIGRTPQYTPERAADVVAYLRKTCPDWGMARAVHIRHALLEEGRKTAEMIKKFEALTV